MQINVGRIPNYITASSPNGLRRLMLHTQLKLGYGVTYFDISIQGKKWYAWYYSASDITAENVGVEIGSNS